MAAWLVSVVVCVATSSSGSGSTGSSGTGHGNSQYYADIAAVQATLPHGADLFFPPSLDPVAVRDCRYRARAEVLAERNTSSLHKLCHRVCPRLAPQSDDISCHEEVCAPAAAIAP